MKFWVIALIAMALMVAPVVASAQDSETTPAEGTLARPNKLEFDERLVKGQTAKSGAVYLFKRVPRQLPGLVGIRRSYRSRIVRPVLHDRKLSPFISHTRDVKGVISPKKKKQRPAQRQRRSPRRKK